MAAGLLCSPALGVTAIRKDLLRAYPELADVAEIRRPNGDQSFTFPGGGTVEFRDVGRTVEYRGACVDRIYVPIGTSQDILMEIRPALATSPDGTLTGY
ncbi:hypothetical protein [Pseudarthrobacter sp. NIBRBAC000502770]|uniref:hypothetical protein n=1 Tax=Pseudarthrobacter sp. NIBRBAC000502770 TaxID=2590785 RepID=UPI0011407255|nr:hypothetical protein [Pseudarthrobacter sp. NIBRBAC000502770]QDG87126.1 hypothetical protein NIBR502770_00415 [Pseudarthrobacter sp. NIBRBAC000502770]